MPIFINRGGETFGPYDEGQVRQMLVVGELLPHELGWIEGTTDWVPVSELLAAPEPVPAAQVEVGKRKSTLRRVLDAVALLVLVTAAVGAVLIVNRLNSDPPEPVAFLGDGQSVAPGVSKTNDSSKNAPSQPPEKVQPKELPDASNLKMLGKVLSMDAQFGFAVVGLGEDQGLLVGLKLEVVRDGKKIGQVTVIRLSPTVAVVKPSEPLTATDLQVGDGVGMDPEEWAKLKPKRPPVMAFRLPEDPGLLMSVKLGKWLEVINQQPFLKGAMESLEVAPLFGNIVRGTDSGQVKISKDRSAYVWMKLLPGKDGAGSYLLLSMVLPLDAGAAELEAMMTEEMRANGQEVDRRAEAEYRIIQNPTFPAGTFAFNKDNFVITTINDAANVPVQAEGFTGESGKTLRAWQKYSNDLVFVGRKTPVKSEAIRDFVANPSDMDMYMDFSRLPAALFANNPDSELAMKMLAGSPLGMAANFDDGALSVKFTVYNDGFQPANPNLPPALLRAIPGDSIALAGLSMDMARLKAFFENGLVPFAKNIAPNPTARAELDDALAAVKKTTGRTIPELMDLLTGDMVLGWAGLNVRLSNFTQPTPKGVLGIACGTPQKARDLLGVLKSSGAEAALKEIGVVVLAKDNHLFICSARYRQALSEGRPLNDGTDSNHKLLTENNLALVATTDDLIDFAKLMDVPQATLDGMELFDRLALTGNFERGKQTYQLEYRLRDRRKNSLIALINFVKPAASAVAERSELGSLRVEAAAGQAEAQYKLAMRYVYGDGVPQDYAKAFIWLSKAAVQGHSKAQNSLGVRYARGQGVKLDAKQAVFWWRKSAEQGNDFAQNNLSDAYFNGQGVEKNLAEYFKWAQRAAEQGNVTAKTKLAWAFQNGLGVERDEAAAVKWYQSAVDQGDNGAKYNLGLLYRDGKGVGRDLNRAIDLQQLVAESDHRFNGFARREVKILRIVLAAGIAPDVNLSEIEKKAATGEGVAQYHLGILHLLGAIAAKDQKKAQELIRKAADQDVAGAQFELATMYFGGNGVKKNSLEAVRWFEKAAGQKYAKAQYNMALMHWQGIGVPRDLNRSLRWLNQAMDNTDFEFGPRVYADQKIIKFLLDEGVPANFDPAAVKTKAMAGDATAQYHLAQLYKTGIGMSPDAADAVRWFQAAAKQGNAGAEFQMGLYHYSGGPGIKTDFKKAFEWTSQAAKQGNLFAQFNLGIFYQDGSGVERNPREAIKWIRAAAQGGLASAQNHLGYCLGFGINVPRDHVEAVKWYTLAAKQGLAMAHSNLAAKYMNGEGLGRDFGAARQHLLMAARRGNINGYVNLGVMHQQGLGVPKNPVLAAQWFLRAAKLGSPIGQRGLAYLLANGIGLKKNLVQAYKWWKLAANVGDASSGRSLEQIKKLMSRLQIDRAEKMVARVTGAGNSNRAPPAPMATAPAAPKSQLRLKANGTGFFITKDGYLITNYHVVGKGAGFKVRVESGAELDAKVVKLDELNDLALLKVEGNFKPLPLRPSSGVELGDSVFTIGFPNVTYQGFSPKLTQGAVNSLAGIRDDARYFQISTPVQPGNSGGALVDEHGNAIGVVSMRLNAKLMLEKGGFLPQNVNYAIKSSVTLKFLSGVKGVDGEMPDPYKAENNRTRRQVFRAAREAKVLILVFGK
jgi:TPR repeat protein